MSSRGIFYYPWFTVGGDPGYPGAWTQGFSPWTQYEPTLGFYDSSDNAVIDAHIHAMEYANCDFMIVSWWGQGSREDNLVDNILARLLALGSSLKLCVYYEAEGNTVGGVTGSPDPTSAQITSDLDYLTTNYTSHANYYKISTKPVIFVYGGPEDGGQAAADLPSARWFTANAAASEDWYYVLKVYSGYGSDAHQPPNWHQYGPAAEYDQQGTHSITISPGFWLATEALPRLIRDVRRWATTVATMFADTSVTFHLITSFNEFGEGHPVESVGGNTGLDYIGDGWESPSGYGFYLDVLHNNGASGYTYEARNSRRSVTGYTGNITYPYAATLGYKLRRHAVGFYAFPGLIISKTVSATRAFSTGALSRAGSAYRRTNSNSRSTVASASRSKGAVRAVTNSRAASATVARIKGAVRALSNSRSASATLARIWSTRRTASASRSGTNAVARIEGARRSVSNSRSSSNSLSRAGSTFKRTITNSRSASFAVTGLRVLIKAVSNSRSSSASLARVWSAHKAVSNSRSGTNAVSRAGSAYRRTAAASRAFSTAVVTITKVFARTSSRTGTISGSVSRAGSTFRRAVTNSRSASASLARAKGAFRSLTNSRSMSAAPSRAGSTFKKALTNSRAASASLARIKGAVRTRSNSRSTTASLARRWTSRNSLNVSGAITASVARIGVFKRSLSTTVTTGAQLLSHVSEQAINRTLAYVGTFSAALKQPISGFVRVIKFPRDVVTQQANNFGISKFFRRRN